MGRIVLDTKSNHTLLYVELWVAILLMVALSKLCFYTHLLRGFQDSLDRFALSDGFATWPK